MDHLFQNVGRVVYGHGSAARVGREVKRLKGSRVLLLTDKGLVKHGVDAPVKEALAHDNIFVEVFPAPEAEPSPDSVRECAEAIKNSKADFLIGLGGGSALDTTKAAAIIAAHGGPVEKYYGMHLVPGPCMPFILIPTAAGTGSEMTSISVLYDPETDSKKGLVSDHLFAGAVILDPDLTVSLPPRFTAYTGLDAFVHSMESYASLCATPFTEGPVLHAMRMIAGNLRKAYVNGNNKEARAQMLYASAFCALGFNNTQNGVIHAAALAVPAKYKLPHGQLVAALAPMGIAFNCLAAPEKYAEVAGILGCDPTGKNLNEQAQSAVSGFLNLLKDLNVAPGLKAYGVKKEDLRGIAERTAATGRLMDNNPRKGNADDLEHILELFF